MTNVQVETTIPYVDPYAHKRPQSMLCFVDVTLKGIRPLLMNRFGEVAEKQLTEGTRRNKKDKQTPREEAIGAAYFSPSGALMFPVSSIMALIREQGGHHKQKTSRKSLKYIVPSTIQIIGDVEGNVSGEYMTLHDKYGKPISTFEVDSRRVVIKATKGSIMRHRPRLDEWWVSFRIRVNEKLLDAETIYTLLADGGEQNGLGDFRPEKGGPYGMFQIHSWKENRAYDANEAKKSRAAIEEVEETETEEDPIEAE